MLSDLFSTEERIRILALVLFEKDLTNSEITNKTGLNKGLVSVYMRKLVDRGLMEKNGKRYAFRSTPLVKQIKILLNLMSLNEILGDLPSTIISLGMYGSFASGENTSESDIDLWVVMEKPDNLAVGELTRRISRMTGLETNITTLTSQKMNMLRRSDRPFLDSFLKGSIVLHGDGIEQIG